MEPEPEDTTFEYLEYQSTKFTHDGTDWKAYGSPVSRFDPGQFCVSNFILVQPFREARGLEVGIRTLVLTRAEMSYIGWAFNYDRGQESQGIFCLSVILIIIILT
jgi:hypothetical protein